MSESVASHPVVVVGASGVLGGLLAAGLRPLFDVALVVRDRSRVPTELAGLPVALADVRDGVGLSTALTALAAPTGGLAGVVNAAGVVAFGPFGSVPAAVVDEVMATNASAVLHLLDAAATHVVSGGFVVNLSGVAAEMDVLNMGVYCASKRAASAAMRVGARELRRRGVRVVDARPGHTETGLVARAVSGVAPAFPAGLDPSRVAARVVEAIVAGELDLPPSAFTG